jgi:hypothetical protein
MLGAPSRVRGVQSYSDSPKKSSSLELISAVIRADARDCVLLNDVAAVRRIVPPRCAELSVEEENGGKFEGGRMRVLVRVWEDVRGAGAPEGGQRPFELVTGDFEMLEIGDYLRYLGERRCLLEVVAVAVADVVEKNGIE